MCIRDRANGPPLHRHRSGGPAALRLARRSPAGSALHRAVAQGRIRRSGPAAARRGAAMSGLLTELKRRNVIRMAGLYLVAAWLLTQVASTVLPAFDVPGWALRGLIIVPVSYTHLRAHET